MRKIKQLLLLVCMISSVLGFSQHSKTIDSLQLLISKQKGIKRAQTLNELSWQYAKKNDSLAIAYAQQARKSSDSLGYTAELATSYIRLGTVYLNANRFQEAEDNLKIALQLEEKENNISGIARAKIQLGKLYKKLRNYDKAIQLYNECIVIQEQQENKKKIARIYGNLGSLYEDRNDPIKALEYYHKSIKFRDSIGDKKGLIISYKNIGAFYNDLKQYQRALIELKKGQKLSLELKDSIQLASILNNEGLSYNHLQKLDSALICFNHSLVIKEKINDKNKEAVYNNIGLIKEKKNKLEEAINFYNKSIAVAVQNNNSIQLIDTYHLLGRTYKKKEQYNKALAYYFDALQLAEKYHKEYRRLDVLSGIGEAYEQLQDYRNAHVYNEKHITLRNQIEKKARENEQAIQMLNEERHKNKLLQIEKQKTEAESKTKNTQLTFLLIGSALMVILFFVLFRSYRLKKQNQIAIQNEKIKQGEIEELLKNQELKSIHAMIDGQEKERKRIAQDLHDRLGSMLSVVKIHYKSVEDNLEKMKADSKTQYEKANELLDEACVAVREISHNMVSGVLTKFGLIPALRELKQNLESTGTLEIELIDYGFDDRIDNELEINIYRIIQELIGNILKHANAKEVSIQLLKRETTINITVIDDGDGFDTTAIANYSGMGIKGIQSRVENLQGEVAFDSGRGNGTTVTIDIPVDPKKHTL
ncbi:sensor histidine kinase [Aquimarina sp. I32.4]|uniref:tetratricopeptide repeat-containing sensor histidine kinase n=1 Tax=Aquimarina sp. I32.4 TaxID=2053903 RepID=UPI000CDEA2F9|nr:sensor histidine kinase [Aquimarina sp. I32.4]